MTNDVRSFTAESMQAALDLVRQELGSDAVIIHTRQYEKRRLLPWQKPHVIVEITAGLGIEPTQQRIAAAVPAPLSLEHLSDLAPLSEPPASAKSNDVAWARAREMAHSLVSQPSAESLPTPQPRTPRPAGKAATPPAPVNRLTIAAEALRQQRNPAPIDLPAEAPPTPAQAPAAPRPLVSGELAHRLDAIEQMLKDLSTLGTAPWPTPLGAPVSPVMLRMSELSFDAATSRELLAALPENSSANDSPETWTQLAGVVQRQLACHPGYPRRAQRRSIMALVGQTGVGKTTTVAKLAAQYKLHVGCRVGLITVDTFRIAAVEQLQTYADLLQSPLKVVTHPNEMRAALDELADCDVVLIDTSGRSPHDEQQLQLLADILDIAAPDYTSLVLSCTTSHRLLAAAWRQFARVSPNSLILSKLDESLGLGDVYRALRHMPAPIHYLTLGQNVPEDLEPATSDRLARLTLALDRLPAPLAPTGV